MHDANDKFNNGKLDLVPMIDCVMLLLLFFILTTKFTDKEKQIAALLPSHGQSAIIEKVVVEPPQDINLIIIPNGLSIGLDPSLYQRSWEQNTPSTAQLRIGGAEPITIDAKLLNTKDDPRMTVHMDKIHAFIATSLGGYEKIGDRQAQSPITIHCFSGLPWSYALCVYDAVRAFEQSKSPPHNPTSSLIDQAARNVTFAPPCIRNYSKNELGNELWELINKK
jgi:biopolymer transport protein ExbD